MRYIPRTLFLLLAFIWCSCRNQLKNDYPIKQIGFQFVILRDSFWKPRIDSNRIVTISYAFKMCEKTGRIDNFEIAGKLKKGSFCSKFPFDDSDVYKIIEGASYTLITDYNPHLDHYLDSLIEKIAAAQESDGYLETWRTIDANHPLDDWWGTAERWSDLQNGHELYNLGHLYEAAAAHYSATGKKSLLNIAIKSANLICNVFGPGKKIGVPGHEEVEIGLMKLFKITGNTKYLNLAGFFIRERGDSTNRQIWGEYHQDHMPVKEQREAVGHAVRAGYLYTAMTDLTAYTNDTAYSTALVSIWSDIVNHKLYITGGVGAKSEGEAFGKSYELPNSTAYSETCAAISMILWNSRMFRLTGDSKYYDFLERTLYNAFLSGIAFSGKEFFYPNPLESDGISGFNYGSPTRQPWFSCACCPSNITRFVPQIPGLIYAVKDKMLYINLYISNTSEIQLDHDKVYLKMNSGYPWQGNTSLTVDPPNNNQITFAFRIPSWILGNIFENNLYKIVNYQSSGFNISVNGEPVDYKIENGYALVNRKWGKGDSININFPLKIHFMSSNDNIFQNRNKVAIQKGPIVYCEEGCDNKNLMDVKINTNDKLEQVRKNISGINYTQIFINIDEQRKLTLIPYSLWSNRGASPMKVWLDYK
jgi:uncharacterized protein